jgi:hypothetical protein
MVVKNVLSELIRFLMAVRVSRFIHTMKGINIEENKEFGFEDKTESYSIEIEIEH